MSRLRPIILFVIILFGFALQSNGANAQRIQTAIFAGGCFWCVESDFDKVAGVLKTTSGYIGGTAPNPTYKQVSHGGTGYYESVKIRFDADAISYRELVDIFWRTVDPLDAGGQFCDRGASYRTAIFVRNATQRRAAERSRKAADAILNGKIVTPILAATRFYPAEAYHQNYHAGKSRVLTRFGWIKQSKAYKKYRLACGRDKRVRQLWGAAAPFAGS